MAITWQSRETRPLDGTPFWAYLYESGIRKVRYWSPQQLAEEFGERPDDFDPLFLLVSDTDEEFDPDFWCPISAIPDPTAGR